MRVTCPAQEHNTVTSLTGNTLLRLLNPESNIVLIIFIQLCALMLFEELLF